MPACKGNQIRALRAQQNPRVVESHS